jgi:hypothetical protein
MESVRTDDDFMLHHATKAQLNRLRKAELVRLWKVAGIWEGDSESVGTEAEEEHEDLRKAQLLQGLLDAVSFRHSGKRKCCPRDL